MSEKARRCIYTGSGLSQSVWNSKDERMVERKIELKRRYHRKKKMAKLKARLAAASGADREAILKKIRLISPWWEEPPKKA